MTFHRTRPPRLLLALGLVAPLLAMPASAGAARFGQPVIASGADDAADYVAAMAPNGRTAVLYRRWASGRGGRPAAYRAAIGPTPDGLGKPRTVAAGARTAAGYEGSPRLLARPDGGFVACFPDASRHKRRIQGCAIAPPGGTFGPLVRIGGATDPGTLSPVVRPDSSVIVLITRTHVNRAGTSITGSTSVVTLSADGTLSPERAVDRAQDDYRYGDGSNIAVAADGTVAIPAVIPVPGTPYDRLPGLRLMAPGADTFGPVIQVSSQRYTDGLTLQSGRELLMRFSAPAATEDDRGQPLIIRRLADGTFTAPQAFPAAEAVPDPGGVFAEGTVLPSGELFGVTSSYRTREGDSDCFDQVAGQIKVGALGLPGTSIAATRISDRGQIALHARTAAAGDGTVVVVWENAAGYDGRQRIEAAVRAPGASAFGKPQVLPYLAAEDGTHQVVAAGNHAAIAWVARGARGSRIAVSTLRAAGPYAKFTKLPRHPQATCDE